MKFFMLHNIFLFNKIDNLNINRSINKVHHTPIDPLFCPHSTWF